MTGGLALLGALIVFGMVFVARASAANILTPSAIAQVARNAGFTGDDLVTAVAIALTESFPSGNPRSLGDNGNSEGLWQIYRPAHPEFKGQDLFDPQTNALAAFSVYQAADNSFSPWSTFNSGKYEAYVTDAQAGVNA